MNQKHVPFTEESIANTKIKTTHAQTMCTSSSSTVVLSETSVPLSTKIHDMSDAPTSTSPAAQASVAMISSPKQFHHNIRHRRPNSHNPFQVAATARKRRHGGGSRTAAVTCLWLLLGCNLLTSVIAPAAMSTGECQLKLCCLIRWMCESGFISFTNNSDDKNNGFRYVFLPISIHDP